jgi:hypothetical protein
MTTPVTIPGDHAEVPVFVAGEKGQPAIIVIQAWVHVPHCNMARSGGASTRA